MKLSAEEARRLDVLDGLPSGSLLVHEIYTSIQGESTRAGLPCVFVRLTGCPLRCRWCDTPYAFVEGRPMTIAQIVAAVEKLSPTLVEVTGGEPLAQPDTPSLLRALADAEREVLLETSGAVSIAGVDERVTIVLDAKCPASGECDSNDFSNLVHLKPTDELKFVIGDRTDFDWAVSVIHEHRLCGRLLLFSPVYGAMTDETLCRWIMESGLPVRFQPQLHKHIFGPDVRGV